MKLISFIVLFLCFFADFSIAQTNNIDANLMKVAQIPENIRPLLIKRINEYVESFNQKEPNQVLNFLNSSKYTDEQKQCIAKQISISPLISFKPNQILFSSANYSRPLNKKSWQIQGEAEFETDSNKFNKKAIISAQFINQNWYFSLPDYYSKEWLKQKLSQSDLSAELNHLLTIIEQPDCPIEISKVSVRIDSTYYMSRKYVVEFTNKTKKTIKNFGYRIGKGYSVGTGTVIKPSETAQSDGNYNANQFFCENTEKNKNIFVDFVKFSDGTKWTSKIKNN